MRRCGGDADRCGRTGTTDGATPSWGVRPTGGADANPTRRGGRGRSCARVDGAAGTIDGMGGVVGGAPNGVGEDCVRRVDVAHARGGAGVRVDVGVVPQDLPTERRLHGGRVGVRGHLKQHVIGRVPRETARFHPVGPEAGNVPRGATSMRRTACRGYRPASLGLSVGSVET